MIPPYITFRETDTENRLCYYILQKEYPHYIGLISVGQMENVLASMPVGNYNLYVNFYGCLVGKFLPSYKDVIQDIEASLIGMAEWFYYHRVLTEPKKYEKFRLP